MYFELLTSSNNILGQFFFTIIMIIQKLNLCDERANAQIGIKIFLPSSFSCFILSTKCSFNCLTARPDRILSYFDPQGRPTVTAGSDHCFHKCCLSVRPSTLFKISLNKQSSSEDSDRYWRDCRSFRVDH